MPRSSNPFRGGNVCHRIDLPRLRRPRAGLRPAAPLPDAAAGAAPGPPAEGRVRDAEFEVLAASTAAREELVAAERARAQLEAALGQETFVAAAQEAAHNRELKRLERRLEKLRGALAEREAELRRLHTVEQADPGLASSYRGVQGLDADEPDAERKRELLGQIFAANLRLQHELEADRQRG